MERQRTSTWWTDLGIDVASVLVLWALAYGDLTSDNSGTKMVYSTDFLAWDTVLLAIAAPLTIWWRRDYPELAFVTGGLLSLGFMIRLPAIQEPAPAMPWFTIAVLSYGVGFHLRSRRKWLYAVGSLVGAIGIVTDLPLPLLVLPFACVPPLIVGHLHQRKRALQEAEHAELVESARLAERQVATWEQTQSQIRVARELHDAVGNQLTMIALQTQLSLRGLPSDEDSHELRTALLSVERATRRTLGELRALVRSMRDEERFEDASLSELPGLLDAVRDTGTSLEVVEIGKPAELSPAASAAAYRTIQECLTNCMRHAPGADIEVSLHWPSDETNPDALQIMVTNRGQQPTPSNHQDGVGLKGLQERLTDLGGSVIWRVLHDGFEVRAEVPVTRPQESGLRVAEAS